MPGNKTRDSPRKETQTLIRAQPPPWLFRRRFDLYTSRSHSGWDFSLNVYNVRPSDAPIFEYVEEGDISAIQQLFQENMASVFDVDEEGKSLLHVSDSIAHTLRFTILTAYKYAICDDDNRLLLETLKFLIECGAPIHARDLRGW